jgi:hypothetical protein
MWRESDSPLRILYHTPLGYLSRKKCGGNAKK